MVSNKFFSPSLKSNPAKHNKKHDEKNFFYQNFTLIKADIWKTIQNIEKLNEIKPVENLISFHKLFWSCH